jgi:HK97 family phage major capsid protein
MKITELRDQVAALKAEIESLAAIEEITPDQDARLTAALDEFEKRNGELSDAEARAARIDAARATITERATGFDAPQIMKRTETDIDVRSASATQVRDAAFKLLDDNSRGLATRQADHVDQLLRTRNGNTDGTVIAKRMVLTENDAYRSAFMKGVTQVNPAYTAEEAKALNEFRAMSEGADSAGGFGVPVLIDPTIILTSGAADAPILNLARIVTITTDNWKGVSSAGVSWSYDAEASEVSDDSPTLAQPTIDVYSARGFIPYSIEVGQDYPGFATEMRRLLDQGYIDLVARQSMTGSGSAPQGIFTALDANTNVEVVVTTDGAFGAVDLLKVWKSLPERYRSRATWIMHTDVENEIRTFAANDTGAYYTINLTQGGIGNLFGRPVVTTDYAPEFTGTTGAANILVVGDFSNFLIAQRAGMTVELVSHLFGTTNNRPTGERGWFAYARHGFDSVNDLGFRLLQNQ